ncbi:hypothetical protein BDZ91DRAFT_808010 [Kalaharituber pfeilii]|nr:hypothetical protein BDZ91DRAFT_808010 [Kalaharituber pfeilii]
MTVLKRFAGEEVSGQWIKDGTTILKGAMGWLFDDSEVVTLIQEEIQMYLHHRRMVNGQLNLGWLRSAYYTQIQQIAQQDPAYYALVAATSPNKTWRQISYPYYMKAVLPGEFIQFQHLDLNLKRYVECGRGRNRIQTSLTLSQETAENCTIIVPGFHNHIKDCQGRLRSKGGKNIDHNGNTLKTDGIFTAGDKLKYGDFVPAICGPGDIRISRPEIIHGSASNKAGKAETSRWVVNPWFVGIQDDHETLDVPESGSWTTVAAAHRDLMATNGTPSGQINIHGYPTHRFPAAVALRHISALSDALIGQRRWDDPAVLIEADLVLGENENDAWDFVNSCRHRMIRAYKQNMKIIRELETYHYGKNSYYYLVDKGLYKEPISEEDNLTREIVFASVQVGTSRFFGTSFQYRLTPTCNPSRILRPKVKPTRQVITDNQTNL